jgi:hypothetical protein
MFNRSAVLAIVAGAVLTTACSDDQVVLTTGPTAVLAAGPISTDSFALVEPGTLVGQLVNSSDGCPRVHPFRAPLNLTIRAHGDLALTLEEVRMRFVDAGGIAGPQVTLPAPALTVQFGTALVKARSARTFPFDFRFGCGTRRAGTIVVVVGVRNERGRVETADLRVSVQ